MYFETIRAYHFSNNTTNTIRSASSTVDPNDILNYFDFYPMLNSIGYNIGNFNNIGGVKYYADVCLSKFECSGFNSAGWLKHTIMDEDQWVNWTDNSREGLYLKKEFNMPSLMPSVSTHPTASQSPSSEPSSSTAPSLSPTLFCTGSNDTTSLFYLELKTDRYPLETYWELIDARTREVVHSVESGYYGNQSTIYNEALCIPNDSCHQFIMYDSYGDGIHSSAYYKILYENNLVMDIKGGNFGRSESSKFFGECPTQYPSASFAPSTSSFPSPLPSVSLPPFSSLSPNQKTPIFTYICVCGFLLIPLLCVWCFWKRQNVTNTHNNNHPTFSTIEEHMQRRRLRVLASIIHKRVLSKRKVVGDNEDPGEEFVLPHEKPLSDRRLMQNAQEASKEQNIDRADSDEALQTHHFSSSVPIADSCTDGKGIKKEDGNRNSLKDNIYLESFQSSQKSLCSSSSLYSPKSCPICLEEYKSGDEIAWSKNHECLHAFHLDCVLNWLMSNDVCPLCRADYLEVEENS